MRNPQSKPTGAIDDHNSGSPSPNRRRSEILAGAIYLIVVASLTICFHSRFSWSRESWTDNRYELAAVFGAALLFVASIRLFMAKKVGDIAALIGTVLVWPYFHLAEFSGYTFSSWVLFNLPDGNGWGVTNSEARAVFAIATSTVLAVAMLIHATAYSALRLMPRSWLIRGVPLCDRSWLPFLVSIPLMAIWYLTAVTPYQIPIYDIHQIRPVLSVWHVEKHGLQFRETRLAFYRDGQFYFSHDDHRLFQYRFHRSLATGVLTEKDFRLFQDVTNSPPEFSGSYFSSYTPPRKWNADRWFIALEARAGRKPINVDEPVVPKEILTLFYEAQKLPQERASQDTLKDVCLGFCYDPSY